MKKPHSLPSFALLNACAFTMVASGLGFILWLVAPSNRDIQGKMLVMHGAFFTVCFVCAFMVLRDERKKQDNP